MSKDSNEFQWDENKAIAFAAYYSLKSADEKEFALYKHLNTFKASQAHSTVIEKKDWEIVSIMSNHHKNTPLYVKAAIDAWLDGNEKDSWHIHSVKRLSDSIVFTVGDNCIQGNIKKFEFSYWGKEITAIFESGEVGCVVRLNDLSHAPISQVREVLFTTEDGIKIYEGDKYWLATDTEYHFKRNSSVSVCEHIAESSDKYIYLKDSRYFSTKEKAEEYILLNKPCLSANDVINLFSCDGENGKKYCAVDEKFITNLVKSKL